MYSIHHTFSHHSSIYFPTPHALIAQHGSWCNTSRRSALNWLAWAPVARSHVSGITNMRVVMGRKKGINDSNAHMVDHMYRPYSLCTVGQSVHDVMPRGCYWRCCETLLDGAYMNPKDCFQCTGRLGLCEGVVLEGCRGHCGSKDMELWDRG